MVNRFVVFIALIFLISCYEKKLDLSLEISNRACTWNYVLFDCEKIICDGEEIRGCQIEFNESDIDSWAQRYQDCGLPGEVVQISRLFTEVTVDGCVNNTFAELEEYHTPGNCEHDQALPRDERNLMDIRFLQDGETVPCSKGEADSDIPGFNDGSDFFFIPCDRSYTIIPFFTILYEDGSTECIHWRDLPSCIYGQCNSLTPIYCCPCENDCLESPMPPEDFDF